jgi:rhodanese-related sulfurtransferase
MIATMTAAEMVGAAKREVEGLTPDQVMKEIGGNDVLLVDLREQDEREASGSITGAIHAPRGMIEFYADPTSPYHKPEFDPARRVILHCAAGSRSALAAGAIRQLGYSDVAHLDGGFKAWVEAGLPIEKE